MSKMDNLRAMREARYDAAAARSPKAAVPRPAVSPEPRKPVEAEAKPTSPEPALCGHRAISGRECTREQGHSEKSHRYS